MARRLVNTFKLGKHTAKVYRDAEWDEYRVVYSNGCTGHHDDREDAENSAQSDLKRMEAADPTIKELT